VDKHGLHILPLFVFQDFLVANWAEWRHKIPNLNAQLRRGRVVKVPFRMKRISAATRLMLVLMPVTTMIRSITKEMRFQEIRLVCSGDHVIGLFLEPGAAVRMNEKLVRIH
jgi:hypothetical protein